MLVFVEKWSLSSQTDNIFDTTDISILSMFKPYRHGAVYTLVINGIHQTPRSDYLP